MKTLSILLITLFFTFTAKTQTENISRSLVSDKQKSILIYSEEEEALIYKSDVLTTSKEILIQSLPVYGKTSIPVILKQDQKGCFTFKKHPALLLPEYYDVTIEDTLTGEVFDLKNSDSYSFVITKIVPERFILQMNKIKTNLTAMR